MKESDEIPLDSSGILGDLTWSGIRVLSLDREGDEEGVEVEWASKRTSRRASKRRARWMRDLAAGLFPFTGFILVVCVVSERYCRGISKWVSILWVRRM